MIPPDGGIFFATNDTNGTNGVKYATDAQMYTDKQLHLFVFIRVIRGKPIRAANSISVHPCICG